MVKVLSQNSRPQFESVGKSPAFLWPPKPSVSPGKSDKVAFNKPTRLQNCRTADCGLSLWTHFQTY